MQGGDIRIFPPFSLSLYFSFGINQAIQEHRMIFIFLLLALFFCLVLLLLFPFRVYAGCPYSLRGRERDWALLLYIYKRTAGAIIFERDDEENRGERNNK
jgi:hypothetical protein